jgi:hypothetical protein
MSGFMFGGSALTLDIGVENTTGFPVERGDVVQVALLNADNPDGFNAVIPDVAAATLGQYAPMGVVQAPPGLEIPNGEAMIVRILGVTDISLDVGATGPGLVYAQDQVSSVTNAGGAGTRCTIAASAAVGTTAAAAGLQQMARAHAVILTARTTANPTTGVRERTRVWWNGLP